LGSDKTQAVKAAIDKLNKGRCRAVYVSCATCDTEHAVLRGVIDQINEHFPRKIFIQNRSNADLSKRLKKDKDKYETLKVVVLDHLESLEETKAVDDLLEVGYTLILVSGEQKAVNRLSPVAQSHFANVKQFRPYDTKQLTEILEEKAEQLLGKGSFFSSLVNALAETCRGNIDFALNLLFASVMKAMASHKDVVDETDIPNLEMDENDRGADEEIIMAALKRVGSAQSGELYRLYANGTRFPKAQRTFRGYMQDLCERELVRAIGTNKGRVYELAS